MSGTEALAHRLAETFSEVERTFGYSIEMIRLVDGERTWRVKVAGETALYVDGPENDYDGQRAGYEHIERERVKARAEALREPLAELIAELRGEAPPSGLGLAVTEGDSSREAKSLPTGTGEGERAEAVEMVREVKAFLGQMSVASSGLKLNAATRSRAVTLNWKLARVLEALASPSSTRSVK